MIIHKEGSNEPHGVIKYSYERENWKEYFRFYIPDEFIDDWYQYLKMLTGFKLFKYCDPIRNYSTVAVRWWFVPFWGVWIGLRICNMAWFDVARFFYKKGLLNGIKEGEKPYWFWPVYLFK